MASRDQNVRLLSPTEPSLFPNLSGAGSVVLQESTSSSPPDYADPLQVPTIAQPSMATNSDSSDNSNEVRCYVYFYPIVCGPIVA